MLRVIFALLLSCFNILFCLLMQINLKSMQNWHASITKLGTLNSKHYSTYPPCAQISFLQLCQCNACKTPGFASILTKAVALLSCMNSIQLITLLHLISHTCHVSLVRTRFYSLTPFPSCSSKSSTFSIFHFLFKALRARVMLH